jgi:hypothetical protein
MVDAPEIRDLLNQLHLADQDAASLVAGLSDGLALWRSDDRSWSVAQCLDHLARTHEMYLQAMEAAASQARQAGKFRRRPAVPGLLGRWLAGTIEPPVRKHFKMKAPKIICPGQSSSLADAHEAFKISQDHVRAFLAHDSDLNMASIKFLNPFIPGLRWTLATGLHIITAHERRHLWQAWAIRRAAEAAQTAL